MKAQSEPENFLTPCRFTMEGTSWGWLTIYAMQVCQWQTYIDQGWSKEWYWGKAVWKYFNQFSAQGTYLNSPLIK